MNHKKMGRSRLPRSTLLLVVLVAVLALIFAGLAVYRFAFLPGTQASTTEPVVAEMPAVPVRALAAAANGIPGDVRCLPTYSVSADKAAQLGDKVVASMGSATLTNAALQIQYLNVISVYRSGGNSQQPDYTQPLDEQECPLESGLSWQHYFLRQAVANWQTQQLLLQGAREPRPITEEAYKPNETDDLHGKYVAADLPVNNFLYQDQPCYRPNKMHQAYLDGLEETMGELAAQRGYESLEDYAQAAFGGSAEELVQAAYDYNFGYMYFTEESYDISVSDSEIASYVREHSSELPGGQTVDMRHVLLIPEGAKVSKDGTVTAADSQWDACKQKAEEMLRTWGYSYLTKNDSEANFARLANENSQDDGSRLNGGSYRNLEQGQLLSELDDWCFDPARKAGDTEIIRTKLGYHIVYFCAGHNRAEQEAQAALTGQKLLDMVQARREKQTLKVNYSLASLWADVSKADVTPADVLYADVAHERFPEAITYFQQDYMFSPYGGSYVGRGGCGITTMAMLATYMTDTVLTPDMLAARYPEYHDASGTRGELFRYTPAEMGFYLEKTSNSINEVIAALQNGQRVISLQHLGVFTSGGHYLLLQQYYEEDDTFQVRDSNIYNYARLPGHKIDKFTRSDILSGSATFYIMQKKITRIPACSRCGVECEEQAPQLLLTEDYICEKCTPALVRRSTFQTLMGA